MYIDILLMAALFVWGIDILNFAETIKSKIWKWATGKEYRFYYLRPFDCSLCMAFWTGILILLFNSALTLPNIAYVALIANLTPQIKDAIITAYDAVQIILNFLKLTIYGDK